MIRNTTISPITMSNNAYGTSSKDKFETQDSYKNSGELKNISRFAAKICVIALFFK